MKHLQPTIAWTDWVNFSRAGLTMLGILAASGCDIGRGLISSPGCADSCLACAQGETRRAGQCVNDGTDVPLPPGGEPGEIRVDPGSSDTTGTTSAGPLRVAENSLYFEDAAGAVVYLTGSHTWCNVQDDHRTADQGGIEHPDFDYDKYLDFLEYWGHNFTRLWVMEERTWTPTLFVETGGKYDLDRVNPAYLDRLKTRVRKAGERGIYASVMMFQGWSGCNKMSGKNWPYHPMHANNNVNGIDGDPDGDGVGREVHTLQNPRIVSIYENYVRHVIDAINEFDNVIIEMGNEMDEVSADFQYHFIRFVKNYEKSKPKQHPVGMTSGGPRVEDIVNSPGEWISPPRLGGWCDKDELYFKDPPIPDTGHVSMIDNDHICVMWNWSSKEKRNWIWKSFTRGHNPIHMDRYNSINGTPEQDHPISGVATQVLEDPLRRAMGDTGYFARKLDLVHAAPSIDPAHCSTRFCLRNPGKEVIVYQPSATGGITIDLDPGSYTVETFDTKDSSRATSTINNWGGGSRRFSRPPHVAEDWVCYVSRQ